MSGVMVMSVRLRWWARWTVPFLLIASVLAISGTANAASPCVDSSPVGTYTMRVCFTAPATGTQLVGNQPVTATITVVSGTSPGVQRMVFYLDGQYLLTDYQAPYAFTLPSPKFLDGAHQLGVEGMLRDASVTTRATVDLTFANGVTTPPVNTNTRSATPGTQPAPGTAFTVAAVGDGASGEAAETDVTNLIASWNPNLVMYLGDVYEKGTSTEFYNWYRPEATAGTFYGRFRSITNPVIGNHEYENGQAGGYFDYWDNIPHYYSVNTHGWHVIELDANSQLGQTMPGTAQYDWLVNDLNHNTQPCTVVTYHQPIYNIGQEPAAVSMSAIWSLLAQRGVDLVLNGHDHTYQRWTPMDGSGNPSASGITELVDGTGGHGSGSFVTTDARMLASSALPGAMQLTFNAAGAGYRFVTTTGQTLDSGSVKCNPGAADTSAPSAPTGLAAVGTYKTQVDMSWTASLDNVGITGYRIFRDGSLLTTVGSQTTYSDTTVAPGSTHAYTVRAIDAAGNASAASATATATTPTIAVLFHDGFESGNLSSWTNPAPTNNPVNNGLAISQSPVLSGSYAARATSTGLGASAWRTVNPTETNLYYEARFNAASHNTSVNLLRFRANNTSGSSIATLGLSSTNKLTIRNDAGAAPASVTGTTTASPGNWHTAQLHVSLNGTSSLTEVWLDGAPAPELTRTWDLGTNPIGRVELGDPGSATSTKTFDVSFDDVAFDREFIGDITPPTAATNLTATAHSGLEVDLSWTPGTDDVAVSGYDLYRNGQLVTSIPAGSGYADKTVAPLTGYTYQLISKDAVGNTSGFSNPAAVSTGDAFSDGFESGDLSKWTSAPGMTVQQSDVDSGGWAAQATSNGTAGASAQVTLDATPGELSYRVRFKLRSQGAGSVSLVRMRTATSSPIGSAFVSSTGKLGFRNDTTGATTTSTQTVTLGAWHELQLHLNVAGATSQVDTLLDGVSAVSQVDTLGTTPIGRLELGDPSTGRSFDAVFDNVLVDPVFGSDTSAPTAPGSLHTTAVLTNEIDLAWTAATDNVGVTGYRVYRNAVAVADLPGTAVAFANNGLTASTGYTYTVTALDGAGHESAPSNAVTATTTSGADTTAPTAPTTVTATAMADTQVNVVWNAGTDNVGVTGYRIFRNGSATQLAQVSGTTLTYSDSTASPDSTVGYTVRSVDAALNVSPLSPSASAVTAAFTDGFETGNFTRWTTNSGLTAQQTTIDTGAWAAQAQSTTNAARYASKTLPTARTNLYYRQRIRIISNTTATVNVLRLRTSTGGNIVSLTYNSSRQLGYHDDVSNTTRSSTTALSLNTWYEVKVHVVITGASSQIEVWLNGTKITTLSRTDNFGTTGVGQVVAGDTATGHNYNLAIDNVWASTQAN